MSTEGAEPLSALLFRPQELRQFLLDYPVKTSRPFSFQAIQSIKTHP